MRRLLPVWLTLVLVCRPGAAAPAVAEEERLLSAARVGHGGPALLEFLRKRSAAKVEREEMQRLVRQLSAAEADADRAQADLIAHGPGALSALRDAQKGAGLNKGKPRIEDCLKWIEGPDATELVR